MSSRAKTKITVGAGVFLFITMEEQWSRGLVLLTCWRCSRGKQKKQPPHPETRLSVCWTLVWVWFTEAPQSLPASLCLLSSNLKQMWLQQTTSPRSTPPLPSQTQPWQCVLCSAARALICDLTVQESNTCVTSLNVIMFNIIHNNSFNSDGKLEDLVSAAEKKQTLEKPHKLKIWALS